MNKPNNATINNDYVEYDAVRTSLANTLNINDIPVNTDNHCILYCDDDIIMHVLTRSYIFDEIGNDDIAFNDIFSLAHDTFKCNKSNVIVVIERHDSILAVVSNQYSIILKAIIHAARVTKCIIQPSRSKH